MEKESVCSIFIIIIIIIIIICRDGSYFTSDIVI